MFFFILLLSLKSDIKDQTKTHREFFLKPHIFENRTQVVVCTSQLPRLKGRGGV